LGNSDVLCLEIAVDQALGVGESNLIANALEVADLNDWLLVSRIVFSRVYHRANEVLKGTHVAHLRLFLRLSELMAEVENCSLL
jgi:hypothetical protein